MNKTKTTAWVYLWTFLVLGVLRFIGCMVNADKPRIKAEQSSRDVRSEVTISQPLPKPQAQATVVQSKYDNLSLGVPGPADTIIDRSGYALGYIEKHEQPAWVIYRMTADEATTKAAKRGDDFRPDPQIPTGSATLADYRRSGYDRGHLAPAADMAFSGQTMSDSFYMSNMLPPETSFQPRSLDAPRSAGPSVRRF
jgi:DNA/RNA endonuclease G (NUC1)